jgi:DUF1365 family protein
MTGEAGALYDARTVHVRTTPYERRFSHRVYQLCLDVDRIGEALAAQRVVAHNRPGLMSFYEADHGDRTGAPLRPWAERAFAAAGVALDGGAIRLLAFPRVLGYVFNPISLFFGYGPDGALRGIIYEVNNTFGHSHAYVARAEGAGPHRHEAKKLLHVSPFFAVEGDYRFTVTAPERGFTLLVENWVDGRRTHLASLKGKRAAWTDRALLVRLLALPLMTLKVTAAIHWQALFIWLRGARYHRTPRPPQTPFSSARALANAAETATLPPRAQRKVG